MDTRTRNNAIVTTDRDGNRAYVWSDGVSVVRDGYGRMAWSTYNRAEYVADYMSDTLADSICNAGDVDTVTVDTFNENDVTLTVLAYVSDVLTILASDGHTLWAKRDGRPVRRIARTAYQYAASR